MTSTSKRRAAEARQLARLGGALLALFATAADLGAREVSVADREALVRALQSARPGDTILVAPGDYRGDVHVRGLAGTAASPIELRAADPRQPPRLRGGSVGLQISDARHVRIRGLVIEEASHNGLNIDDGGSFDSPSEHLLLEDVTVRRIVGRGNRDGIKLSGVVDFRLLRCRVERWGDGGSAVDMVGCHRGELAECVFEHDDPVGANGVQLKGGSEQVRVRRCRFVHAGGRAVNLGGSTGLEYFRPAPRGFEAKDLTVEDCEIIGSQAPFAFVGVDGAVVRHNVVYRPRRWLVRILQENRAPGFVPSRGGRVERNIFVWRSDELRQAVNVGDGTAPDTFAFEGNVWHCVDRPSHGSAVARSLPSQDRAAITDRDPRLAAPEDGDLAAGAAESLRGAGPRPRATGQEGATERNAGSR